MWGDSAADTGSMVSFPQEFPFVRRQETPPAEPVVEPVVPEPVEAVEIQPEPVANTSPVTDAPAPVVAPTATPASVAPSAAAGPRYSERRKTKRDNLAAPALIRLDGVHGPPLKVEILDISVAGVRFRAPHRIDVGDKAQIRLEVGPFRWTTRLRVIHCASRDDGAILIGCGFLRTELLRPWPIAA
jgi:hypothetical protein